MRTTIDIDPGLLREALALTGEKRRGKIVDRALAELIRREKIERLIALAGTIDFVDDWAERHEREVELEDEHRRDRSSHGNR